MKKKFYLTELAFNWMEKNKGENKMTSRFLTSVIDKTVVPLKE